ncbi:pantoate--beta-alanine ligase [Leifsonia sp. A12D58]|uniref:pantoate--beta-alanine ligase n=1 Tax=Leifsonia sp. A12D58 TaxID=3397674 RepID=UPI0039DFD330
MTEPRTPEVVGSIVDLRERIAQARAAAIAEGGAGRVSLVPTMGALHEGHLSLVARAGELADVVVVSIFVNPLQFGDPTDLDLYPRTLDTDVAKLTPAGVDFVFAPTAREMYPNGASGTTITAGPVGSLLEGASRPGHFDGVLTVVDKLIKISGADVVLFGQKDAQQVFLVQSMVTDLNTPVQIEVVPIVRADNGLALSSRNARLSEAEQDGALALNAALAAASAHYGAAADALAAARAVIEAQPLVKLDYLVVVHPETFLPVDDDYRGPARMLVAALVGGTRLIDNTALGTTDPDFS